MSTLREAIMAEEPDAHVVSLLADVAEAASYRQAKDDTCWCPDPVDDDTMCGACRVGDALDRLERALA